MTSRKFDSLIFDLDGTLWDASETSARAWTEILKDLDMPEYSIDAAQIRAVSGLSVDRVFKEHFTFIPEDRRAQLLEAYKPKENLMIGRYGGRLYEGVRETLLEAGKKVPLFVVSNCLSGYIENFIAFHNLGGIFTDFECSGNTGKPKSDNIQSIIMRNALKSPVYVGDTVWDQESAFKAGIPFIFARYGFGEAESPDTVIDQFSEVLQFIE